MFERYGIEYEIANKIDITKKDVHNYIITNIIYKFWNEQMLSPAQSSDISKLFTKTFE